MIIKWFAWPHKVKSAVPGWKGWRLHIHTFLIAEPCDIFELLSECDNYLDDLCEDDRCRCCSPEPHNHWGFGYEDKPIGKAPWNAPT